jgi:hypothetical protein
MSPQEISKRYKRQSLGMPGGTPSSSAKIRSPFRTLYFYCFVYYVFFLERLYLCLQFFFWFSVINGWITSYLFWKETRSIFIALNTLVFTHIVLRVFSFSSTAFSFRFLPWFLFSFLFLWSKVYLDLWSILVFISKSRFKKVDWCWKGEKSFMPIVVQMGACLDCGLDFYMSCLMLFW